MKLKGILDFSLGNFLCLRGFAPMGVLYALSDSDPSFQRDLLKSHRDEMVEFLREGEFLFFPEVILCTTLSYDNDENANVVELFEKVRQGLSVTLKFADFRVTSSARRTKKSEDIRAFDSFQTATVDINDNPGHKFFRIDGNHRLSATPEDEKFNAYNAPFCLILFRNNTETARFSRVLFHNINYKQIPLSMEENLKLILDDIDLFPDEKLKTNKSFGWPYYLARKLINKLDFELLSNVRPIIEKRPRTFLTQQLQFLLGKGALESSDQAIKQFKEALGRVNALFDKWPALKQSSNRGLLASLVYYELRTSVPTSSFVRWVLDNHLHLIRRSNAPDLIKIFDKVLESRNRTVFVSMPFGKTKPDDHYAIIQRVCKEVSDAHNLKPPLKVQRVDWFHDGTSYAINEKIFDMMSDCGLLIGNLTLCNPNVYHEIGFVMGKAKAEGKDVSDKILLFLDESLSKDKDKYVAFNLKGLKQIRFTVPETGFAPQLRENIEKFFKVT